MNITAAEQIPEPLIIILLIGKRLVYKTPVFCGSVAALVSLELHTRLTPQDPRFCERYALILYDIVIEDKARPLGEYNNVVYTVIRFLFRERRRAVPGYVIVKIAFELLSRGVILCQLRE